MRDNTCMGTSSRSTSGGWALHPLLPGQLHTPSSHAAVLGAPVPDLQCSVPPAPFTPPPGAQAVPGCKEALISPTTGFPPERPSPVRPLLPSCAQQLQGPMSLWSLPRSSSGD